MKFAGFYHRPPEHLRYLLPRLAADLLAANMPGLLDVIPAYQSLYAEYDPRLVSAAELKAWFAGYHVGVGESGAEVLSSAPPKITEIPVCYDGEDLAEVAALSGLTAEEAVILHSSETYTVRALGFVAGFPFMDTTPAPLQRPRRPAPRAKVPPHSLAIAGAQTGIYPVEAPGGWNLLGRTLQAVYDPNRPQPFLLEPGQQVRFRPVSGTPAHLPPPQSRLLWPTNPQCPVLKVQKSGALTLLMDKGRFFSGRYGLVRSGYLDEHSARLASDLLGNDSGSAMLEMHLTGPKLEILSPCVLACAGRGLIPLLNGEPLPLSSSFRVQRGDQLSFRPNGEGRVTYLAVLGGFETAPFMGSASTDLKGGLGRAIQTGDILGRAGGDWNGFHLPREFRPYSAPYAPLRLLPVAENETLESRDLQALCAAPFILRDLDRMAARLKLLMPGLGLVGGEITSEACPVGTIQVPPSGEPLVLLNDKGTLGGYRKPARVHPDDLPRLVQTLSGQPVRFIPA